MNKASLLAQVQDIVRDVLDFDELNLTLETTADSIDKWDSLAHITIIGQVESDFKIKFNLVEIAEFSTVGKMVDAISLKISASP